MAFKFKYDSVMKQDIISYMSTVEDTGLNACLLRILEDKTFE